MKIQLQGHTDDRGSAEFNIFLGENRANSVKHFLVSQGVKEEHISIISYGKEKPAAFCPDTGCATKEEQEEVWQKNRRVEFVPQ
jgi:peptidoglycan-associated lipoprotein